MLEIPTVAPPQPPRLVCAKHDASWPLMGLPCPELQAHLTTRLRLRGMIDTSTPAGRAKRIEEIGPAYVFFPNAHVLLQRQGRHVALDNEGAELPDITVARREADGTAGQMLSDLDGHFWNADPRPMWVTDKPTVKAPYSSP